jgi:hypothetical protein
LDLLHLLLVDCAVAPWFLVPHIVCQNQSKAVMQVCVKKGGAPSAQTPVVNASLLYVLDKFPTQKDCGPPWLVMADLLMHIVGCVCAHVWNFVLEP